MKKISLLSLLFPIFASTASWGGLLHCDVTQGELRGGGKSFSAVLKDDHYTGRYHLIPENSVAKLACTFTAEDKSVPAVWFIKNPNKVKCRKPFNECGGYIKKNTKYLKWGGDAANGITVRFHKEKNW
jgi:hypothetical protein